MKILLLHVISLYSKTNIQLQKNKNTKTKKKNTRKITQNYSSKYEKLVHQSKIQV